MDALAVRFNFTWKSYKDLDGNWGVTPTDGVYNRSGTWSGVMGSIVNGEYHISLNQWFWKFDRYELLDFVGTNSDYDALAITPSPPEVDFQLFIRPFKHETWLGLSVTLIISLNDDLCNTLCFPKKL